jgi:hypothetical protein
MITDRIGTITADAMKPDAPRIPGAHCQRCLACESCEKRREIAVREAALAEALANPVERLLAMPEADRTAAIDALLAGLKKVEEVADQVKDAIEVGTLKAPGYIVVQATREGWTGDAKADVVAACMVAGVPVDSLMKLASPKEVKESLGQHSDMIRDAITRTPIAPSVRRVKHA